MITARKSNRKIYNNLQRRQGTFHLVEIANIISNKEAEWFLVTSDNFAKETFLPRYENLTDSELVAHTIEGSENAFEEIVRRYSPRVFRFAGKFFSRRSLIEEAAQEVFLKAYTQLGNFEGRGSLEGWLTRITVTTCINILRSTKRESELTIEAFSDSDEERDWLEMQMANTAALRHQSDEEKLIAADLVNRVLDTMSPEDRLVLTMVDGEGYSMRDVSQMTGWTESKVKVQAFRARRRMREAVEKLLS